jgi:hypothetical protein
MTERNAGMLLHHARPTPPPRWSSWLLLRAAARRDHRIPAAWDGQGRGRGAPSAFSVDGRAVRGRGAAAGGADLYFGSRDAGIGFGDPAGQDGPIYRDFAYVAFTIGLCYQVSDTTVGDRRIRGTVLAHAFLSYVFGVVIVAGSVNLIAGLLS